MKKEQRKIILASSSPRRRTLLEQIGLSFTVDASNGEEDLRQGKEPHKLAQNISLQKARLVAVRHPDALIIAADTLGVIDGKIIGKPGTEEEAREMLSLLSGRPHRVITGLTVMDTATGKTVSRSVETTVYFKRLSERAIDAYVRTGEPMDKAAAYGIHGLGAVLVEKIEGDYFNIVGLPLSTLASVLADFGIIVP